MNRLKGFSLVELLIVIVILGLALVLGIPSYRHYIAHEELRLSTEDFIQLFHSSEKTMLSTGDPVIICPSFDKRTCSAKPKAPYLIAFADKNHNALLSPEDDVIGALDLSLLDESVSYLGFPYANMHVIFTNTQISSNGSFIFEVRSTKEQIKISIGKSGHLSEKSKRYE